VTRRWLVPALFGALCLAQIAVPASMIARYELTLSRGTLFKVRTAPVDPVDAFRGRYVRFRLALDPVDLDRSFIGQKVWVALEEGPDGFAKVGTVSATRPAHASYVEAQVTPLTWRDDASRLGRYQVVLPHDRYYMQESKAPQAEVAARVPRRSPQSHTWVTLRVRDGIGAVEGLWIDGAPVEEYLRRGR
jgi:GDYXXLXY protein